MLKFIRNGMIDEHRFQSRPAKASAIHRMRQIIIKAVKSKRTAMMQYRDASGRLGWRAAGADKPDVSIKSLCL
jgi:hypothetical protein